MSSSWWHGYSMNLPASCKLNVVAGASLPSLDDTKKALGDVSIARKFR
jgi:hypothetical protein